jgi:predicted nucleotide-binding protein
MVATADDVVTSRHHSFDSPRDNVLYEFGLFAGGLGRNKVFYVVEQGIKIPGDLSGITLPTILKKTDGDFEKKLMIVFLEFINIS